MMKDFSTWTGRRQRDRGAVRWWAGLIVVLALLAAASAGAIPRDAARAQALAGLARVDSLLADGDADSAVAVARGLVRQLGDDPAWGWQIDGRLGVALLAAGQPAEAVPLLEDASRRQPRDPAPHRNLGAALLQLNRRGRALSEYQVAVELDPTDPDLRREYGQMLLAFRDLRRAGRELYAARELCGGCPELDQPLASYHLLAGQPAEAVPFLETVYGREPTAETRTTLLAALNDAGADSALAALIAAGPESGRSTDEWRLLVEAEGRLGQAVTARRMADLLPNEATLPAAIARDDRFWGRVALDLIAVRAWEPALRAADHAVALAPASVVHRNNRVVILTALERHDEARAEWDRVVGLDSSLAGTAGDGPTSPEEKK